MKNISDVLTKSIRNGIVHNMPREDYNAISALNTSSIAAGLVDHHEIDPMIVKCEYENTKPPPTPAAQERMDRGTVAHMLLLQPERVQDEVAIWKGGRRAGAAYDQWCDDNRHATIQMKLDDWNQVSAAVRAFRFEKRITDILTDLDAEVAMLTPEGAIHCKGMVDAVTRGPVCKIIDIKTTEAGISDRAVENTVRTFKNREKMAAYKRWYERESGREVIGCYNLFLQMVPPYGARIVKFTTNALEWGEMRIVHCLDEVSRCLASNQWPLFIRDSFIDVAQWECPIEGEVELDFADN